MAEKPLISEETDLLEPTLLDELMCHIGTLASVYHKPPNTFVEGRFMMKTRLSLRPDVHDYDETDGNTANMQTNQHYQQQQIVISNNVGSLIDDFDIMGPMPTLPSTTTDIFGQIPQPTASNVPNLLDEELSSILGIDSNIGGTQTPMMNTNTSLPMNYSTTTSANELDDLFSSLYVNSTASSISYSTDKSFVLPKEVR